MLECSDSSAAAQRGAALLVLVRRPLLRVVQLLVRVLLRATDDGHRDDDDDGDRPPSRDCRRLPRRILLRSLSDAGAPPKPRGRRRRRRSSTRDGKLAATQELDLVLHLGDLLLQRLRRPGPGRSSSTTRARLDLHAYRRQYLARGTMEAGGKGRRPTRYRPSAPFKQAVWSVLLSGGLLLGDPGSNAASVLHVRVCWPFTHSVHSVNWAAIGKRHPPTQSRLGGFLPAGTTRQG